MSSFDQMSDRSARPLDGVRLQAPFQTAIDQGLLAQVTDMATGYEVRIVRSDVSDNEVEYRLVVFGPNGGVALDETASLPLLTDGTGHKPFRVGTE